LVRRLEGQLSVWRRQIERVLTETEQVRREADDVGPDAELHYWKTRMANFSQSAALYYADKTNNSCRR